MATPRSRLFLVALLLVAVLSFVAHAEHVEAGTAVPFFSRFYSIIRLSSDIFFVCIL
jgi:hypothetical protein